MEAFVDLFVAGPRRDAWAQAHATEGRGGNIRRSGNSSQDEGTQGAVQFSGAVLWIFRQPDLTRCRDMEKDADLLRSNA